MMQVPEDFWENFDKEKGEPYNFRGCPSKETDDLFREIGRGKLLLYNGTDFKLLGTKRNGIVGELEQIDYRIAFRLIETGLIDPFTKYGCRSRCGWKDVEDFLGIELTTLATVWDIYSLTC